MADTMSTEDRLAVMDLIASYAYCLDAADVEGYVNNFAPDGVFEGKNLVTGREWRHEGRDAIRPFVHGLLEQRRAGPGTMLHILGIPSIHGTSERCSARTYVMVLTMNQDPNAITLPLVGVYTDDIVKIDGRWHFQHRFDRLDMSSER